MPVAPTVRRPADCAGMRRKLVPVMVTPDPHGVETVVASVLPACMSGRSFVVE